jgi:hypothetical protein
MATILLAVVIVVVIAVIMMARARVRRHSEFLNGYWVATSQFAADAKLSEFQLFIAPSNSKAPSNSNAPLRQGYIIIVDADGTPVANQAIELRIKPRRGIRNLAADEYRGQIAISPADESESEELPFPASLEFSVSVFNGALTLFDKEAVFASLTKDYATTEAALNAYAK